MQPSAGRTTLEPDQPAARAGGSGCPQADIDEKARREFP
jgi:hypothetical protein